MLIAVYFLENTGVVLRPRPTSSANVVAWAGDAEHLTSPANGISVLSVSGLFSCHERLLSMADVLDYDAL